MLISQNPYIAGNPVGGETAFVGRADVLRAVSHVLESRSANAIVLYGQRRIGKTSILQQLAEQLSKTGAYQTVYFDLQDKAAWSLAQVLQALARETSYGLALPEPNELDFEQDDPFRRLFLPEILKSLSEDKSLVFLFDEFDVLDNPGQSRAGTQFFPYVRRLLEMDRGRLKFVFVIGRKPEDLTNLTLSIFKKVKSKRVSLLDKRDTLYLIRLSQENGTLKWTDEALESIWRLTNGHPFLTQQLCQIIWNYAYDEDPAEPPTISFAQVEEAIPETIESSVHALEWLWSGLAPAERFVASALAQAGPQPVSQDELEQLLSESGARVIISQLQEAPQILQDWDLIEPSNGGYRFRVELLRRWIAEKKPISRVQEELDRIEPVANNLYEAGYGLYQSGQLEQAVGLLRQSLGINPNHLNAGLLLAQILLAQDESDEAITLLERIYDYNPGAARPRLVQALLDQVKQTEDEEGKLDLYDRILDLTPKQPEAVEGRRAIWKARGDVALKINDLENALHAYQEAEVKDKIEEVQQEMRRRALLAELEQVETLEQAKNYSEALEQTRRLAEEYPEDDWSKRLIRLEEKTHLASLYKQALDALQRADRQTARTLLAQIVNSEPDYEEATRYLHLAVTGEDVEIRHLSPWDPLDYLRLLWWALVVPQKLKEYQEIYGDKERVGKWLVSLLAWVPLLIPVLASGVGLLPLKEGMLSIGVYLGLAGILLAIILLTGWFGDSGENWAGGVAFIAAVIVAGSVAGSVAGFVAVGVAGVAGVVAGGVAGVVAGGVARSVALGVAVIVALGVAVIVAVIVSVIVAGVVAPVVAFVVAFVVALSVVVGVGKAEKGGAALWLARGAFGALVLSHAFLIWFSFLGGWQVFQ